MAAAVGVEDGDSVGEDDDAEVGMDVVLGAAEGEDDDDVAFSLMLPESDQRLTILIDFQKLNLTPYQVEGGRC